MKFEGMRRIGVCGLVFLVVAIHGQWVGAQESKKVRFGYPSLGFRQGHIWVAKDEGRSFGADAAGRVPHGGSLERLAVSLRPHGYEPRIEDERMVLENCPFDKVARDHTELVCGLNLDFVDGVADGLGCDDLRVTLEPSPGRCCVSARRES